jgi:hypothetical protein
MKPTSRLILALALATSTVSRAQDAAPAATLTDQQVNTIMQQLKELEKTIEQQRGGSLASIIQKINAGAASDAAAMNFFEECEKVLIERQDIDRGEARKREQAAERQNERRTDTKKENGQDQGDFATAVRLQLRYLALTLEAHETKDIEKMVPKLTAFVGEVLSNAEKLKGRAGQFLAQAIGGGGGGGRGAGGGGGGERSPFVAALQIERYLDAEHWSHRPLDFGDQCDKTVFPILREKKKSELAAQWDARINNEAALRKVTQSEAEFALWGQNELPTIRWARARDLFANSDKPLFGMRDMIEVIRTSPGHADATSWLAELKNLVARNAPGAQSEPGVPPAGTAPNPGQ